MTDFFSPDGTILEDPWKKSLRRCFFVSSVHYWHIIACFGDSLISRIYKTETASASFLSPRQRGRKEHHKRRGRLFLFVIAILIRGDLDCPIRLVERKEFFLGIQGASILTSTGRILPLTSRVNPNSLFLFPAHRKDLFFSHPIQSKDRSRNRCRIKRWLLGRGRSSCQ